MSSMLGCTTFSEIDPCEYLRPPTWRLMLENGIPLGLAAVTDRGEGIRTFLLLDFLLNDEKYELISPASSSQFASTPTFIPL
jgi:hypothetical protein